MNRDEAKSILLLYRHGTADAADPQIATALAFARQDEELARWLEMHCAKQVVLSEKLRRIAVPPGFKEQVLSEIPSDRKVVPVSFWKQPIGPLHLAAVLLLSALIAAGWFAVTRPVADRSLAAFKNLMTGIALSGYGMDLLTNDPVTIRTYLSKSKSPSDYVMPAALQKTALAGCAVELWQNGKVSMICFRTGKPLEPGMASDLWLFVADRTAVKDTSIGTAPAFSKVGRLITATWTSGDKIYLLGIEGDEQAIRQYL